MSPKITFYYQPHQSRKAEAIFTHDLIANYPDASLSFEKFQIPARFIERFLPVASVHAWLSATQNIPPRQRADCLKILEEFPAPTIRVALKPHDITFDIVACKDEYLYFWEYHESQHARLTVSRPSRVFTPEGQQISVPRYFQRLVRDLWRVYAFPSYTIVWHDWYESTEQTFLAFQLEKQFREFSLPGKLSLADFLSTDTPGVPMSPHPEILALLTAFQHSYTQRDPALLDEFMLLFAPEVEAIGTNGIRPGQGEWFRGREAVRGLIQDDWESWGDFQLDFDSLQIRVQADTAWVSAFATVANTIGPEAYQSYLAALPALLEDPAHTAPEKLREILRGASNTLYELEKGERFIWPVRFTAVAVRAEPGWQFAQLHFSFATTRFPDVRLSD